MTETATAKLAMIDRIMQSNGRLQEIQAYYETIMKRFEPAEQYVNNPAGHDNAFRIQSKIREIYLKERRHPYQLLRALRGMVDEIVRVDQKLAAKVRAIKIDERVAIERISAALEDLEKSMESDFPGALARFQGNLSELATMISPKRLGRIREEYQTVSHTGISDEIVQLDSFLASGESQGSPAASLYYLIGLIKQKRIEDAELIKDVRRFSQKHRLAGMDSLLTLLFRTHSEVGKWSLKADDFEVNKRAVLGFLRELSGNVNASSKSIGKDVSGDSAIKRLLWFTYLETYLRRIRDQVPVSAEQTKLWENFQNHLTSDGTIHSIAEAIRTRFGDTEIADKFARIKTARIGNQDIQQGPALWRRYLDTLIEEVNSEGTKEDILKEAHVALPSVIAQWLSRLSAQYREDQAALRTLLVQRRTELVQLLRKQQERFVSAVKKGIQDVAPRLTFRLQRLIRNVLRERAVKMWEYENRALQFNNLYNGVLKASTAVLRVMQETIAEQGMDEFLRRRNELQRKKATKVAQTAAVASKINDRDVGTMIRLLFHSSDIAAVNGRMDEEETAVVEQSGLVVKEGSSTLRKTMATAQGRIGALNAFAIRNKLPLNEERR